MSTSRTIDEVITCVVGKHVLNRSIRSHKNVLEELSRGTPFRWTIGSLNQTLRNRYGSAENVSYHRQVLLDNSLIEIKENSYSLTPYAYSLLSQSNLDKLISDRGFDELDLLILLELLNARTEHRRFGLRPSKIALKLGISQARVYKSGSRLGKAGLVKRHLANELPKVSQRMYTLTGEGKEVGRNVICSAMATRIMFDYEPTKWVPLAELMLRRFRYPETIQKFIERSFAYLTNRVPDTSNLCQITFNMFPWLEQMTADYVIQNYMKEVLEHKKDISGFEVDKKYIFTGNETVANFVKQTGARVVLFALESLGLPEAQPLIQNSILLGGMEGPMAYCVVGVGKSYNEAVYESETLFSKRLVMDVASELHIRGSRIQSISGGHDEYLKVIDSEICTNVEFHTKTPFDSILTVQSEDVTVLRRVPIVLGVLMSADDEVGMDAGIELVQVLQVALKILAKPNVYADAVLNYVHRLPKINQAFNQVRVISKLEKCGVKTHAEFD